jgi:hypothetical protein
MLRAEHNILFYIEKYIIENVCYEPNIIYYFILKNKYLISALNEIILKMYVTNRILIELFYIEK